MPLLDLRVRWRAGQVLLGLAALVAAVSLLRPLAPDHAAAFRASVAIVLAAGVVASALVASLRGRGRAEALALYAFLVLAADAVGQVAAPVGWPAWPLIALVVGALAVAETAEVASGAAALASALAVADVARRSFTGWPEAVASAVGYAALVAAIHHAERLQKRRLTGALDELDRLRYGVEDLEAPLREGTAVAPARRALIEASGEGRRARQVDRAAELDAALGVVVRLARAACRAHAVLYLDFDRERDRAYARAADGPPALQRDATVPLGADPVAYVRDREQSFYVTDFPKLLSNLPYYRGEVKVGTLLAVPVRRAGFVRGALVADRLEIQSFTGDEPALLESFAELIGETLHDSHKAADREEQSVQFKAVYEISTRLAAIVEPPRIRQQLINCARDIAHPDSAAVVTVDRARGCYVVQAADGWAHAFEGREVATTERTWAAWVIRQQSDGVLMEDVATGRDRMPILVLDEGPGRAESLLVVPLRSMQETLAALVLTGRRGAFDATAKQFLTILANQAAGSLRAWHQAEQAKTEALHDALTGLENRRAFMEELRRAGAREDRQGGRFALLALDIDHFKKLNDTYGHPAGDAALRNTAAILRRQLRKGDVGARIGGEEFAVLLPGTDEPGAAHLAERIRSEVAAGHLVFEGAKLSVTLSVGLAVWPQHTRDAGELLSVADRALYAAKEGGRNRVVSATTLAANAGDEPS